MTIYLGRGSPLYFGQDSLLLPPHQMVIVLLTFQTWVHLAPTSRHYNLKSNVWLLDTVVKYKVYFWKNENWTEFILILSPPYFSFFLGVQKISLLAEILGLYKNIRNKTNFFNLQFLSNVIIIKTKILLPKA